MIVATSARTGPAVISFSSISRCAASSRVGRDQVAYQLAFAAMAELADQVLPVERERGALGGLPYGGEIFVLDGTVRLQQPEKAQKRLLVADGHADASHVEPELGHGRHGEHVVGRQRAAGMDVGHQLGGDAPAHDRLDAGGVHLTGVRGVGEQVDAHVVERHRPAQAGAEAVDQSLELRCHGHQATRGSCPAPA
ncbi:hypothetical protein AB0K48_56685 [Nonomuraea sp. NPDC055795]